VHRVLRKQVRDLKAEARKHAARHDESFRVGVEVEVCLLDGKARPVNAARIIEALSHKHQVDYEYGQSQLEYRTDPVSMTDIESLNLQIEDFVGDLDRTLRKVDSDAIPVFLGANPSPLILKASVTDKARYRRLARWQKNMPNIKIDGYEFPAPQVAMAIQGFHMHLQGRDPDFTAQMFNHILNLIPSIILVGANSRLFAGRLLSLYEPRIFMYDQSEQQNSGFPAIPRYLRRVGDYIDYVASRKPVIAKDYFGLVKERHDDARIQISARSYRVETRVMSVQPTAQAMMAMIEFFIGYLHRAIHEERKLRPLAVLREERQSVVRSGFRAKSHFHVAETARSQLAFARKGLADLGIKSAYLGILESRIENKTSAGEYVAKLWQSKNSGNLEKATIEIISDIWERTRHNKPISS